jgi:hypothetical protein
LKFVNINIGYAFNSATFLINKALGLPTAWNVAKVSPINGTISGQ